MASTSNNNVQSSRQAQRLDFRTTRDGVVPSSIGSLNRLTLDAAMKAALTHAGAKLVIEIDAGGTRVLLADGRTNQLIGGPEDLQKLGSIRTFVNRERKDAAGVESAKEITQLAFLAEQVVKEQTTDFVMKPVDSSYGAAVRPLHAALEQMFENLKKLDDNTSVQHRSVYEPEIRRLFTGIGNAYTETISALTRGETLKGVLATHLYNEGVPDWVHSRFVSKTFVLERTGELGKLFFPADPTKGLALSIKEWRNKDFVQKQGPLVQFSQIGYKLVNDDELLFAITGIANTVSLEDEENPQVAKLLKSKLVAMPVVENANRVIELGSKSRSGFKFPNPSMDTVTGAISALSTALLRVYSANLQSVDLVGDYYATIAPGAVNRSEVTPTNNFYVQWGKTKDPSNVWIEAIKGGPNNIHLRRKVWRWIRTEMRLSEMASAGKALARAFLLQENGNIPTGGYVKDSGVIDAAADEGKALIFPGVPARPDTFIVGPNKGLALHRALSDTEIPFWNRFQERVFAVRPAKKKQSAGIALTPLTSEGKSLLLRVKKLSPYVAERMHQWLRSFSDERLQRAAIKVTNAEFDDMFSSALADEEDAESVMDWAEQEA